MTALLTASPRAAIASRLARWPQEQITEARTITEFLQLDVEDRGDLVVVAVVRGEATGDRAAYLAEQLRLSLAPGAQFVILDLGGLTCVDSSALAAFAELSRALGRRGGEVWLASLQPAVWLALRTAELDRLFTIRASLAQALAA
jgi:anti-anti-sigma factor